MDVELNILWHTYSYSTEKTIDIFGGVWSVWAKYFGDEHKLKLKAYVLLWDWLGNNLCCILWQELRSFFFEWCVPLYITWISSQHLFQISKDQIWLMLLIWDSEAILEVIYIYKVTQMKKKHLNSRVRSNTFCKVFIAVALCPV